ncbi:MAG: hypothetical protein HOM68_25385 [Gemmatimonadetes bacterium]|jgi:methyl-accepting chemotaxis protein|nr:hypothetical protein [Gemmatimonadota bacterium]MBT5059904.1 hypothetical protein [Gemmatimonadota bacterium]MBT5142775.1 hypothetical protein [Gemmatimonadota bacterium]MBT5587480.1 hypothetical protein [Gemmatimonadota bacterium]MBT5960091.1 hypothetical protein [Gemmatimonadota bacterium]
MQWFRDLPLRAKLVASFGVVLAMVAVLNVFAHRTTTQSLDSGAWVEHTHEVIDLANEALAGLVDMETGYRGFLVTGEDEFLEPYEDGTEVYQERLAQLQEKTADNPEQVGRWRDLERRASAWQSEITEPGMALRRGDLEGTATVGDIITFETSGEGKRHFDGMRAVFAAAIEEERTLMAARSKANAEAGDMLLSVLLWGTVAVLGLGFAVTGFVSGVAKRVDVAQAEAALKTGIVENATINIMVADKDFKITYVNPASLKTLKNIEHVLPVAAEAVVGSSIDIFHKNPPHQRGILSDPRNLPHHTHFPLGDQHIDLTAAAIYDEQGRYVGPMVSWSLITETVRLETEASERSAQIERQAEETERQRQHVLAVAAQVKVAADGVLSSAEQLSGSSSQLSQGSERQTGSVEEAAGAIQQLAASARGVSQNTDELARLVTENSAALTQLATSIVSVTQNAEQMSQTVMSNSSGIEQLAASIQAQADNAEQANDSAQRASERAHDGAEVVRQAIEGMERIANRVRESAQRITELGRSSEQVSTIVAVINDIADQTNLLALNAAIEAARAGEQGRGFAVVAEAVRELAERTSQATQEIDDMIGKIQGDTRDVVSSMEEGMRDVEQGTELASRSGSALSEIAEGVEQVNQLMAQLTASSREQAMTSDQIVQATAEMNELVQQVTRAMAEQSQAVDVISHSSEEMQGRVDQVSGAMREQQEAAEQSAGSMEEINQLARSANDASREMDTATDQLATQADDLNKLAGSFEEGGESGSSITDAASNAELDG